MNKIQHIIVVAMTISMMGCPTRSLFPLFTEKDLVFDQALVGTWDGTEDGETYAFQRSGEKGYAVVLRDKSGDTRNYNVQLGRLGTFLFTDTSPSKGGGDHHFISAHLISRIALEGDTLRMSLLESDWLRDMIDAKKLSIAHVRRGGEIILTATTEELQSLVLRFAEDDKAFPNPAVLVRMK